MTRAVDTNTQVAGLQSMEANTWHGDALMHGVVMGCLVAHLAQQVLDALAPEDDPCPRGREKSVRFFYDQMFVKHPVAKEDSHRRDVDALGDQGQERKISMWGGQALPPDINELAQMHNSLLKFWKIARTEGIEGLISTHGWVVGNFELRRHAP